MHLQKSDRDRVFVRCAHSAEMRLHDGRTMDYKFVDKALREWLEMSANSEEIELKPVKKNIDVRKLEQRRSKTSEAITSLAKYLAEGIIDAAAYQSAVSDYLREIAGIDEKLSTIKPEVSLPSLKVRADFARDWDILPVVERRQFLRETLEYIEVFVVSRKSGEPRRVVLHPKGKTPVVFTYQSQLLMVSKHNQEIKRESYITGIPGINAKLEP